MTPRLRLIAGLSLIAVGVALLGLSLYAALNPAPHYSARLGEAADAEGFALAPSSLTQIEIAAPDHARPLATGLLAHEGERPTPLSWRNAVTEPIFFADLAAADMQKVLAAIREHAPQEAVVFAWWDLSRAIRLVAQRNAPLDDPRARGLQIPAGWSEARAAERARFGAGVAPQQGETFSRFTDALVADEAQGADVLAQLAGGKPAFICVHISDAWKLATEMPARLSLAFHDFAASTVSHGVIKSAQQWMRDEKVEGGYAVEPMGAAVRLHFFRRKADGETLIARLLPFSTSNPLQLARFALVYQHKGWWIYQIKTAEGSR